jgi:hypothetical protein
MNRQGHLAVLGSCFVQLPDRQLQNARRWTAQGLAQWDRGAIAARRSEAAIQGFAVNETTF